MKWVNHQAVTGVLAYAVTDDLLFTIGAVYGAIIPDKIEGRRKILTHRGISHYPLLYIVLFFGLLQYFNIDNVQSAILSENQPLRMVFALIFGALCHIAEDALCGKVPTITPKIKCGVRLFKVGTFQEYIIVIFLIILIYLMKYCYYS